MAALQLGHYSDVSAVCIPFVFAQLCKELTAPEVEKATIVNLYRDIGKYPEGTPMKRDFKHPWPITGDDFVRSFYPRQGNFALSCEALLDGDCVRTIDLSFNTNNCSCTDISAAIGHTFYQEDSSGSGMHTGAEGVLIDVSCVDVSGGSRGVVTFQMKNCNRPFVDDTAVAGIGQIYNSDNNGHPSFRADTASGFGTIISDTIISAVDLSLLSTWHYLSNWVYAPGQGAGFDDGDGGVFDVSFNLVGFALGQWANDLNVPSDCWTPCSVLRITEELLKANYICNLKCDVCCSLCSYELAQALNSLSNAYNTSSQYQGRDAQRPVKQGDRLQLSILFTNPNTGTNPVDLRMNFQISSDVTGGGC